MFEEMRELPSDPVLSLMQACRDDPNPNRMDLGVGVYKDEHGNTPVLDAVKIAESRILAEETTKTYIGPLGDPLFNACIEALVFDPGHESIQGQRVCTIQTPGGCGALRVAADFIKSWPVGGTVWIGDPTWVNHVPIFSAAGNKVRTYPYYAREKHALVWDQLLATLRTASKGDVVVLHGCCHNPSGADLTTDQWDEIAALAERNGLIPLVDIAYQGFAESLESDAYAAKMLARRLPEAIFAISCSKNFGLYRERVGAVMITAGTARQIQVVRSHLAATIRPLYSMPPSHGASVVRTILSDPALRARWVAELDAMRMRLKHLRGTLASRLVNRAGTDRFEYIASQHGMFSILDIDVEQVRRLRQQHAVYLPEFGRINIAALREKDLDYLAAAIVSVLPQGA